MNTATHDRAIGAVLNSAADDALGAGYEFKSAVSEPTPIRMTGGGSFGWAPGEWTDDTSMGVPILRTLARGGDPADESPLDVLVVARDGHRPPPTSATRHATSHRLGGTHRLPQSRCGPPGTRVQGPLRGQRFAHAHGSAGAQLPPRR